MERADGTLAPSTTPNDTVVAGTIFQIPRRAIHVISFLSVVIAGTVALITGVLTGLRLDRLAFFSMIPLGGFTVGSCCGFVFAALRSRRPLLETPSHVALTAGLGALSLLAAWYGFSWWEHPFDPRRYGIADSTSGARFFGTRASLFRYLIAEASWEPSNLFLSAPLVRRPSEPLEVGVPAVLGWFRLLLELGGAAAGGYLTAQPSRGMRAFTRSGWLAWVLRLVVAILAAYLTLLASGSLSRIAGGLR